MNQAPGTLGRLSPWALGTWAAVVLYHASFIGHRWIPIDEGTIGQSAWRILAGEVPHRDFDAMYTGLLEYMHAGAMQLLGVHLLSPRLVMLGAIMLWVPALWALARRLTRSPAAASFVTVLAFLAGPPNYPAAMPSWYNLFLASWGLWALVRWSEERRPWWLLLAGVCGGLSILFKIAGLFFVAGALFFVLHLETWWASESSGAGQTAPRGPAAAASAQLRPFAVVAAGAVVMLVVFETVLIRSQMGLATWINYVLATVFLGGALVWQAGTVRMGSTAVRGTARGWVFIGLGVLIPILPFLGLYAAAGGLDDLYRGVFLLPFTRTTLASGPVAPLRPSLVLILVPTAILFAGALGGRTVRIILSVAAVALGVWLYVGIDLVGFIAVFTSMLLTVPLCAGVGAAVLARGPFPPRPWDTSPVAPLSVDTPPFAPRSTETVLLATLWTLALVHLIRYPYAGLIYFTYVAPLAVLAVAGILSVLAERRAARGLTLELPGHPVPVVVGGLYALFFLLVANRGGMFGPLDPEPEADLVLERGRLAVPAQQAGDYTRLAEMVRALSRSEYIYATPDSPEVYFLSGLENPTRTLFEIFEGPGADVSSTLQLLEAHDINVVVLNARPVFSPVPRELAQGLAQTFPNAEQIGHFVVRWRGR